MLPEDLGLSRSRLQVLIRAGAVSRGGRALTDPKTRVAAGEALALALPAPAAAEAAPEAIPLTVVFEDDSLIVIDKPAGMVVHPAPGAETGTLVNALLHHCGASLAGIGGVGRPGIVHRIDKDTSGLLVAAKTARAHQGLSEQFAAREVGRRYDALAWGVPGPVPRVLGLPGVTLEAGALRIDAPIGRHPADRKKMTVRRDGRRAVTRIRVERDLGVASLVSARLETGRTHQIRVHLARIGHPLMGDPVYGAGRSACGLPAAVRAALSALPGQALHAGRLAFRHPGTGAEMTFEAPPPPAFAALLAALAAET